MVQSGKERALRTKVHFNSIILLDRFPLQMGRHTPVDWHNREAPGKALGPFG